MLSIKDNGIGLSPGRIADALNGKSEKHVGKGIGLLSAQSYMNTIGGKLVMKSKKGLGTCVKLYFRITNESKLFPREIKFPKDSTAVILDDEVSIHSLWKHKLNNLPVHTKHFWNYEDALTWSQNEKSKN